MIECESDVKLEEIIVKNEPLELYLITEIDEKLEEKP